jgi:hypothetical protein
MGIEQHKYDRENGIVEDTYTGPITLEVIKAHFKEVVFPELDSAQGIIDFIGIFAPKSNILPALLDIILSGDTKAFGSHPNKGANAIVVPKGSLAHTGMRLAGPSLKAAKQELPVFTTIEAAREYIKDQQKIRASKSQKSKDSQEPDASSAQESK